MARTKKAEKAAADKAEAKAEAPAKVTEQEWRVAAAIGTAERGYEIAPRSQAAAAFVLAARAAIEAH